MAKKKKLEDLEYSDLFLKIYAGIEKASNGDPKVAAFIMYSRMSKFYKNEVNKIKEEHERVNSRVDQTYIQ